MKPHDRLRQTKQHLHRVGSDRTDASRTVISLDVRLRWVLLSHSFVGCLLTYIHVVLPLGLALPRRRETHASQHQLCFDCHGTLMSSLFLLFFFLTRHTAPRRTHGTRKGPFSPGRVTPGSGEKRSSSAETRRTDGAMAQAKHGMPFEVDARYEVQRRIGQGSYGTIAQARDRATGETVAIKKIRRAFEDAADCKKTLREIKLLQHFNHENILQLKEIMVPSGEWLDLYLVFERMDSDLHHVLRSKQILTNNHIRWFAYQILRGVAAIHDAHVLHRDLKPGNILINRNCDIKICDFGLARGVHDSRSPQTAGSPPTAPLTEYVVTRWYRAPELLCQNTCYGREVDVWSVGCVLAEMLGRKPFLPGRDYLQQVRLIVERIGADAADLDMIEHEQAREYVQAVAEQGRSSSSSCALPPWPASLPHLFPQAQPEALSLLSRLLVFNPSGRISATDALNDAYVHDLHQLNEVGAVAPFDLTLEEQGLTEAQLRALCWGELLKFHPEVGLTPPRSFVDGVMLMQHVEGAAATS